MALTNDLYCPGHTVSLLAGAALDSCDCVKIDSTEGRVIKTAGDNEAGYGFVAWGESPGTAGDGVSIIVTGIARARAAGSITAGDWLISAADGEVNTVGATADTLYNIVGMALTAAAGANEYLSVLVQPHLYTTESA